MEKEYLSFFITSSAGSQERIYPKSLIRSVTFVQNDKGSTLSIAFEDGFSRTLKDKEANDLYKELKPKLVNKAEKERYDAAIKANEERAKKAAKEAKEAQEAERKAEEAEAKKAEKAKKKAEKEAKARAEKIKKELEAARNPLSNVEKDALERFEDISENIEAKLSGASRKKATKKKTSKR